MKQAIKISVIVTLYKDIVALNAVLEGLKAQTYKYFEVVVAEDDDSPESAEYIKSYTGLDIIHISHKDVGRTKTTIQNKAICTATGDYLVFLDGDCIPYSTYLEGTISLAREKRVLAGRRLNLNQNLSSKLRSNPSLACRIEKYFALYAFIFAFDKESRFEQGIHLNPDGLLYKVFLGNRRRNTSILGCNWSCYKDDILAINGFDESLGLSILGDDTDLDWRFIASGCELVSSKNIANVMHLYHPNSQSTFIDYDPKEDYERYLRNKSDNIFYCEKGLNQYC